MRKYAHAGCSLTEHGKGIRIYEKHFYFIFYFFKKKVSVEVSETVECLF